MDKSNTDLTSLPKVLQRFLRYTEFQTASDADSKTAPSTPEQVQFARVLLKELLSLGVVDARVTPEGIVFGSIPASPGCENLPALGLIAHMDTSPEANGGPVNWRIVTYRGSDIVLNAEEETVLSASRFPELAQYHGQEMVVTDGCSLLGADDKAGIAVIMGVVDYITANPSVPHAKICIAFTPDEEIGRGTDHFDLQEFGADYAYTVDGGEIGQLDSETFNAAIARVTMHGLGVHPGKAKGKMVNALRLAAHFVESLPRDESPERTEGREGFFHPIRIEGGVEEASVILLVRDHDADAFEVRKSRLIAMAEDYERYGKGTCSIVIRDQYYNMKQYLAPTPSVLALARRAMRRAGVTPVEVPVRGGTDGARLSETGLPCPNIFTGGLNFHGVYECLPIPSLLKSQETVIEMAKLSAEVTEL